MKVIDLINVFLKCDTAYLQYVTDLIREFYDTIQTKSIFGEDCENLMDMFSYIKLNDVRDNDYFISFESTTSAYINCLHHFEVRDNMLVIVLYPHHDSRGCDNYHKSWYDILKSISDNIDTGHLVMLDNKLAIVDKYMDIFIESEGKLYPLQKIELDDTYIISEGGSPHFTLYADILNPNTAEKEDD